MTSLRTLLAATGNRQKRNIPEAVDYDGTNDYVARAADLNGNSDSSEFTLSIFFYQDRSSSSGQQILVDNDTQYFVVWTTSTQIIIQGRDSSNNVKVRAEYNIAYLSYQKTWNHILFSCDTRNSSKRELYFNDISVSPTYVTYSSGDIDFTRTDWTVGASFGGTSKWEGRLAHVFLDYTYRDLDIESERRKFVNADLTPVNATDLSPILYLKMEDPTTPGANSGTGGDFTLSGVVARSGRGPNQYNSPASTLDGSTDYLSRSAPSVTDGKQFIHSLWFKPTAADISGNRYAVQWSGNIAFATRVLSSGQFRFTQTSTTGANAFEFDSTDAPIVAGKWYNLAVSADMTDSGKRHVHLNGAEATGIYTHYNDVDLEFNSVNQYVGRDAIGNYFGGEVSDLYIEINDYLDLSSDNPFYDSDTEKPKSLGADGSTPTGTQPWVYLPLRGNDAGNNLGSSTDFTVNSGPYDGARGPSEFWASAAELNGSSQYFSRGQLDGIADGKEFTIAMSVALDASANGYAFNIDDGGGSDTFTISLRQSAGRILIYANNAAGTQVLSATVTPTFTAGQWYNILISIDLSNSSNRHVYIDDVSQSVTWATYTNDSIDFTSPHTQIGAQYGPNSYLDGKEGFLWFDTQYIDISQEANRLLFFDAFGYPVDLGSEGKTPTGNQPAVYVGGIGSNFKDGTNLGSGGDFTPVGNPTDGGSVKG